jgi:putative Ca2+/H+ antiporter (TMEM165/GDT1 family)
MESFLVSAGIVAIAEIGDKTQLLALLLAARYRRPLPIIAGILLATLANHGLAAWAGAAFAAWVGPQVMRYGLAVTFLAMAGWCLIPDRADDGPQALRQAGAFVASLIAFFLLEIGDKTQLATVALAARYHTLVPVIAGTTLGMLLVNVPAVLFGDRVTRLVPLAWIRLAAAGSLAVLGLLALFGIGMPEAFGS